ncbi:MAG: Asp-tRNA(Asn)/Glu-tRNA(Gln) amidotransferase GatCAB subunit C [Spirochaetaceae bacterium]|jgi:aspartyl-tRNA(Asn)/glutamyl-tRNA(Gln) amidotransferase subunit C|nr:Asp-tRNA(Asn)/Glu-tRNA(Gln) amidotransferase GatCAB subunit C [Spirochaetaceae bacterium]
MSSETKKIDDTTLETLLYLSRLSPESSNVELLREQVGQIVEYFDILSAYDDNEDPYDAYSTSTAECLRADEIVPGLEVRDVKAMTSEFLDGYFRVPKVLGGGA